MFSPTLLPLYFITMFITIIYIIVYYNKQYYFKKLPALCDRCLGRGWVWQAGLVAGLRVGQAFGMFLLPGFGVGSSSPWVPGHPTSMCDSGINVCLWTSIAAWLKKWQKTPLIFLQYRPHNRSLTTMFCTN